MHKCAINTLQNHLFSKTKQKHLQIIENKNTSTINADAIHSQETTYPFPPTNEITEKNNLRKYKQECKQTSITTTITNNLAHIL